MVVNKSDGTGVLLYNKLRDYLESDDKFKEWLNEVTNNSHLIFSESEAIGYKSLIDQNTNANTDSNDYYIVPNESSININLVSLKYSIYETAQTLLKYVEDSAFPGEHKSTIASRVKTNATISASYYVDLPVQWTDSNGDTITKEVY